MLGEGRALNIVQCWKKLRGKTLDGFVVETEGLSKEIWCWTNCGLQHLALDEFWKKKTYFHHEQKIANK